MTEKCTAQHCDNRDVEKAPFEAYGDSDAVVAALEADLLDLRGSHGRFTLRKFMKAAALRYICGGNDVLDGYLTFRRELQRYVQEGTRDEAAAAISITAPADTVLDRLEHVVGALPQDGLIRDQRTGRRWSDDGIRLIARDLVHLADNDGRLGNEFLVIEATGDSTNGLDLTLSHIALDGLERAPMSFQILIPVYDGNDVVEAHEYLSTTLDEIPCDEAVIDEHRQRRHHVHLDLADVVPEDVEPGDALYVISLTGFDSPMRTVVFRDNSNLAPAMRLHFTTYRNQTTIDLIRSIESR